MHLPSYRRHHASGRIQIEVVTLGTVEHRCLVNVMAAGARDVADMGCVRIGLIGDSLRCHLCIGPVAFDANRRVRLFGRRALRVTRGTVQSGRHMLVDEKAVPGARRSGRRRCLRDRMTKQTSAESSKHSKGK